MSAKENKDELPSDVPSLIDGIKALQPGHKQQMDELFEMLYPAIKEAMARSVAQGAILKFLRARGLKVSPNTFRVKLAALEKREKKKEPGLSM